MRALRAIRKASLKKHIGRYIQVRQRDGSVVRGKLVAVDQHRVYIKPLRRNSKGKPVTSNWIIALFLLGIVFVGLFAFWGARWGAWGGYGYGGGYGYAGGYGYGGYGGGYGYRKKRAYYV